MKDKEFSSIFDTATKDEVDFDTMFGAEEDDELMDIVKCCDEGADADCDDNDCDYDLGPGNDTANKPTDDSSDVDIIIPDTHKKMGKGQRTKAANFYDDAEDEYQSHRGDNDDDVDPENIEDDMDAELEAALWGFAEGGSGCGGGRSGCGGGKSGVDDDDDWGSDAPMGEDDDINESSWLFENDDEEYDYDEDEEEMLSYNDPDEQDLEDDSFEESYNWYLENVDANEDDDTVEDAIIDAVVNDEDDEDDEEIPKSIPLSSEDDELIDIVCGED